MVHNGSIVGSVNGPRRLGDGSRSCLSRESSMSQSSYSHPSSDDKGDWKPASTAPFVGELELAVIDNDGIHALVFPCRRVLGGWVNVRSGELLAGLIPSHWREWRST